MDMDYDLSTMVAWPTSDRCETPSPRQVWSPTVFPWALVPSWCAGWSDFLPKGGITKLHWFMGIESYWYALFFTVSMNPLCPFTIAVNLEDISFIVISTPGPTLFYCKWLCPRLYICFPCIVQRLSLPIPDPFGPLTCEVEEAKEGFARSQLEEESGSPGRFSRGRPWMTSKKNVRPVIGF